MTNEPKGLRLNYACPVYTNADEIPDGDLFCSHCSKNVVNHTQKSDEEILSFLEKESQHCGQIRLNQVIRIWKKQGLNGEEIAQRIRELNKLHEKDQDTSPFEGIFVREDVMPIGFKVVNVYGIVFFEDTREPVPFVEVLITSGDEEYSTTTDLEGNYSLSIPITTGKTYTIHPLMMMGTTSRNLTLEADNLMEQKLKEYRCDIAVDDQLPLLGGIGSKYKNDL